MIGWVGFLSGVPTDSKLANNVCIPVIPGFPSSYEYKVPLAFAPRLFWRKLSRESAFS